MLNDTISDQSGLKVLVIILSLGRNAFSKSSFHLWFPNLQKNKENKIERKSRDEVKKEFIQSLVESN